MAEDNQFGFYRDIQLNNGAMVVSVEGGGGGSGTSGTSGAAGTSGTNGANGTSGTSGSGTSGTNGDNGTSGTNGANGTSGTNGANGSSGTSGTSGGGGGGSATSGSHFNLTLSPGQDYNLGYTPVFAECSDFTSFQDRILAFQFTPGRDVKISGITMDIYRLNGNTAGRLKYLAYDHNVSTGLPNNLIIESTEITPSQFAINQYNVNYTFSAGTTYWLAIAFSSNMSGPVGSRGLQASQYPTIASPNFTDGYGLMYKMAVSSISSWPTIPSTWANPGVIGFYGSYVFQGYYGGTNNLPEIRLRISA